MWHVCFVYVICTALQFSYSLISMAIAAEQDQNISVLGEVSEKSVHQKAPREDLTNRRHAHRAHIHLNVVGRFDICLYVLRYIAVMSSMRIVR